MEEQLFRPIITNIHQRSRFEFALANGIQFLLKVRMNLSAEAHHNRQKINDPFGITFGTAGGEIR